MSTPSGKPFNPFDLSPYAPKRARERPAQEDSAEQHSAPEHSAQERPEERPVLDEEDEPALPLSLASSPPEPAAADERDDPERGRTARSAAAASTADTPAAARSAAGEVRDRDLERLESSLQWLQREGKADRLPRAVQLPNVSGLRPVAEDSRSREEQFINGIRVPPSLAPERLRAPPPMRERGDHLRGPLRVLLAGLIAAPIAYYFSVGGLAPSPEPARETELASFASRIVASTEFPIPKDELRPGEAEDYNSMISARNRVIPQPASAPGAASPRGDALPRTATAPAADPGSPASAAVRELDPETVKLLMRQGEQFLAAGDLITARQVFRRAAEAGDAAAALAMGATFDPSFLAKLGMRGSGADVDKARSWYEQARSFGSPDAPRRLEMLATR
jgi:hypothetical protein